jgi:hypothetical protein
VEDSRWEGFNAKCHVIVRSNIIELDLKKNESIKAAGAQHDFAATPTLEKRYFFDENMIVSLPLH